MFSMTPLQSWALIILLFGAVIIAVWAFAGPSGTDAQDAAEDTGPLGELIPFPQSRTRTASAGPVASHEPTRRVPASSPANEPYDWVVDGL